MLKCPHCKKVPHVTFYSPFQAHIQISCAKCGTFKLQTDEVPFSLKTPYGVVDYKVI